MTVDSTPTPAVLAEHSGAGLAEMPLYYQPQPHAHWASLDKLPLISPHVLADVRELIVCLACQMLKERLGAVASACWFQVTPCFSQHKWYRTSAISALQSFWPVMDSDDGIIPELEKEENRLLWSLAD